MYSQEITRRHRAAIVLMLDRSASMQGRVRFGRMMTTKAEAVAMTANMLITELIDRCRRTDALRNYFDVAVVGYGNDCVEQLLSEDGFVSVEALARRTPRMGRVAFEEELPDGTAAMVEHSRPCWVDINAEGNSSSKATRPIRGVRRARASTLTNPSSERSCSTQSLPYPTTATSK